MIVKRVWNALPSKDVQDDWRFETARLAGIVPDQAAKACDLRQDWWAIGNQGQTGSCVGWAVGDGVIRWHLVKSGRIAKADRLSERYLWMAAKETDDDNTQPTSFIEEAGTTLKAALDVARSYGVVKDALLPFQPPTLYPGTQDVFYATASQLKIASYFNLGMDLGGWRHWIGTVGPIAARLVIDQYWDGQEDQSGKANAGKLDAFAPYAAGSEYADRGHFVAIVGYDDTHFIVRNSWGAVWGDKGFGYATDSYVKGIFTEAYGISA